MTFFLRVLSGFLVLFLFVFCMNAYALPPWLKRGGAEKGQEEEILKMPDFDAEEEETMPYYDSEQERAKGPFLWIFIGFLATAFITSL
jgi:hypothetical protein